MATVKVKYYEGIGRRKTTIGRVRLMEDTAASFVINDRPMVELFPNALAQEKMLKPLVVSGMTGKFSISVKISGGGTTGWVDAISLGIARALIEYDAKMKSALRTEGLVTRDPRAVERKKAGLKKARKAPRFSKR